jgi:D-hexose-6-phosphate mutarotase
VFSVERDSLDDVLFCHPWTERAQGMEGLAPNNEYKNMTCGGREVTGWQSSKPGDAFGGAQTISIPSLGKQG